MTRKERLTLELEKASATLDAFGRSLEVGMMRTQQKIAGQRAQVLGLRSELVQIAIDDMPHPKGEGLAKKAALRADRDALLIRIKEAELSGRAASKQATEDDLPEVIRRLKQQTEVGSVFDELH